jgi:hypothetical protein
MALKQNNLIGLILIAVGALALLGNFGWLGDMSTILFSVAMAVGGVYLIRYHVKNRQQFWASIVGFTLFGLALAAISEDLAGFYFLGSIGAGFIFTYLQERKHWWAVIPGGVLVTLGTIVAAEEIFPRWDAGGLFFAGLAATFGYLYAYERKRWAIYPAVALLVIGLLGLSFTGGWVFPALLIAAGVYALSRSTKSVTPSPVVNPSSPVNLSPVDLSPVDLSPVDLSPAPVASSSTDLSPVPNSVATLDVTPSSESMTQAETVETHGADTHNTSTQTIADEQTDTPSDDEPKQT